MTHFDPALTDGSDALYAPLIAKVNDWAYWRPTAKWRKLGYTGKALRLPGKIGDTRDLDRAAECRRLTVAMLDDLGMGTGAQPGTWGWLIERYQGDSYSPYHTVKGSTRATYAWMLTRWKAAIGHLDFADMTFVRIKEIETAMQAKGRSTSYIRRMFVMLRTIASYGRKLGVKEVRDVREIMADIRFKMPPKRTVTASREQAMAVIAEADSTGMFGYATGVLIQWATMLRGVDVFGQWLPAQGQGGIIANGNRWQDGLTWDMFDADLMGFSKVVSKTASSMPAPIRFSLAECPELRARLALLANGGRIGPVIRSASGLPYTTQGRGRAWRRISDRLKLPREVMMMDLRAGGITEAMNMGATTQMLRDAAGHLNETTTNGYMRGRERHVAEVIALRSKIE